ncbi:hypothetical protein A3Q56_01381 [Intoshia linei]|uniref:Uncharacterized protein n=1 Tax=Intoshia linei TaxID=1819745 RepID=A0A177BBR9_9BILA|nr:hypothetical protein A3Q56_01381 [Intoshia linei]
MCDNTTITPKQCKPSKVAESIKFALETIYSTLCFPNQNRFDGSYNQIRSNF